MDELYEFACRYLEQHPVKAGMEAVGQENYFAGVTGKLLYREGAFQVQFFAVPGNFIVPSHTHPNVDSFEVYVDGQIKFSHRGKFVFETSETVHGRDPDNFKWRMLRVLPQDLHGSVTGPQGARFISIQKWLNDVTPDCVSMDYTGPAMDLDHFDTVTSGAPEVRRQQDLKPQDAL